MAEMLIVSEVAVVERVMVGVTEVLNQKPEGMLAVIYSVAMSLAFAPVPSSRIAPLAAPSVASCNWACTMY